jgi:recombination-promoting nuclease RpnB
MGRISYPHDHFFRMAMSHPAIAADIVCAMLPEELLELIDPSTILAEKDVFVDSIIGSRDVDSLFSAKFKAENMRLYILLEHQSSVDKDMAGRLFKYMWLIIDFHKKQYPDEEPYPLIYPGILYIGRRKYTAALDVYKLFKKQEKLARKYMSGKYEPFDLSQQADEKLAQKKLASSFFIVKKYIKSKDISVYLQDLEQHLSEVATKNPLYFRELFKYIIINASAVNMQQIIKLFRKSVPQEKEEDNMITIAQKLEQIGEKRGEKRGVLIGKQEGIKIGEQRGLKIAQKLEQKGELKGKQEATKILVFNLQRLGQSTDFIAKATGMSEAEVEQITQAQEKLLC